jgi:hypothetical protein
MTIKQLLDLFFIFISDLILVGLFFTVISDLILVGLFEFANVV